MKKKLSTYKDKNRLRKGVSLITLVITIVVILVLAAIGIAGSIGAIDEAAIADFKNELKGVEVSVSAKRINNQKGGIGEEFKEKGFVPVFVENPPEEFVSFGEGDFYGYVVDLEYVAEDSTKKGSDYKKYSENLEAIKTITFGKKGKDNDVYIYDAMGKVFYAKGYYVEGGVYYSDVLTQDGPIISIEKTFDEDANVVNLKLTVEPEVDGTNLVVDINGDVLTKEEDGSYKYTVISNGTYIVNAEEDVERISKKRVSVTEIKEIDYKITYHYGYDSIVEEQIKKSNIPVRIKGVKRDGYILEGWSKNPAATSVEYNPGIYYSENADMELYAVWTEGEPREFIVTYNANGGKNAPEADTKIERETMQLSTEVPTKTGYLFKGWSKSSSGDVDYLPGADYSEDKNIVLFAVWEEGEIRVELSVSPGDAGEAVGGGAKEAGRIVYVTAVAKPGYVFSKWTVDASSTNVNLENIYAETTKFTMPNGTVSLTANFKQTEYDYVIRYDANGGSGAPNTQYKKHDENINISTTIPHRSGYTFEGWSDTLSNKTVKYVSGAEFSENRNVTLYAVWTKNTEEFTLKFDANGGTNPPVSITKTKDTIISIPSESPDNGTLIFLGWSEDKDADVPSYKKNDSYTITQNQTLYAVWSDKENPVIDITITEENRNLVLFGNAVDNGGIVKYSWTNEFFEESNYLNIPWTDLSDARKEISIRKDVINSGMHYFYAIDGDGNVSYASIEVYRLSFIANGTRIDVKYKANGYDASLTDIIPETDMYVFNKWQAESDGRTYTSDEKYLLNRNENFEATWTEAAAYVPSTNKYFITTQDAVDSIEENTADYVVVRLVRNETTSGVEITNGRKIAYEAGSNTLTKSTTGVAINSVKVASLTGSFKLADTTSTSDTAVRVLSGAAFKLVNGTISSDSYAIRNLGTFEIIGGTVNGKYGIYNNGHVVLGDGSIPFDRNSMSVIATAASYLEATDTATATYVNGSLIDHDTTYQVPTSRMTLREDFEIRKIDSTSNVVTTIIEDLVMTSAVTAGTTAKPVEVKVTLSCVNSSYTFQYSTDNTNWTTGTSVTLIDNATVYGRILDGDEVVNTEQLTIDNIVELTVTFNAQGIITNPSSAKVKYQRTYGSVIPNTTDTSDYWFDGWFTASSGGTQVTGDTIVTKTSDHTLYAHWTLKNQSPNAPTISLTSRGTTYINVKVTATDPDGDDIYYKITVDGSTYNTSTVASGQSSSKSIYSLDDFTTYTISAVTVDSLGAKSSATQYTFKTKCAGTENTCTNTWHCQGYTSTPIDCTNSECTLGRVLSVNCPGPTGSDVDCSNCTNGKVPYTCPGADTDCPYCCPGPNEPIEPGDYSECPDCHAAGKFWHRDWACSTCGSTGDGYYCESCGSTTGTTMNHNNQEDCTNCGGDGTIESAKCEHGYTDKHSGTTKCTATGCESGTIYAKCSHGNTEAHKEYTTCSTCGGSGNSGYNISSCEHGYDQQSHYYCDISGHGSYRGENDYHTYNYCSTHDEYGSHDG